MMTVMTAPAIIRWRHYVCGIIDPSFLFLRLQRCRILNTIITHHSHCLLNRIHWPQSFCIVFKIKTCTYTSSVANRFY